MSNITESTLNYFKLHRDSETDRLVVPPYIVSPASAVHFHALKVVSLVVGMCVSFYSQFECSCSKNVIFGILRNHEVQQNYHH